MKKFRKILSFLLVAATVALLSVLFTVIAGAKEGYIQDGVWYEDGVPASGWFQLDGKTYYASKVDGKVVTEPSMIGGKYYVIDDALGLVCRSGWYDLDQDGVPETYYYKETGLPCTESRYIGGVYYVYEGGKLEHRTGWYDLDGDGVSDTYYFMETGVPCTGSRIIGDKYYKYVGGKLVPGNGIYKDYYFVNGVKQSGWQEVDGNTYYFYGAASMYGPYKMCKVSRSIGTAFCEFDANGVFLGKTEMNLPAESAGLSFMMRESGTLAVSGALPTVAKNLIIPAEVLGYKVTLIMDRALANRTDIDSVLVPPSVTVGKDAFKNCGDIQIGALAGWFDLDSDGVNETYYYKDTGVKRTESGLIGGEYYVWDGEKLVAGNGEFEGKYYENGVSVTGWHDGNYYRLETGVKVTDKVIVGDTYYVYDGEKLVVGTGIYEDYYFVNGVKQSGWQEVDGNTYYFYGATSMYGPYKMCKVSRSIGTAFCEFDANGVFLSKTEMNLPAESAGLSFIMNEDGTLSVSGALPTVAKNLVIPTEVLGYTVSAIAPRALANRTDIESITVPAGITVGEDAFKNCPAEIIVEEAL